MPREIRDGSDISLEQIYDVLGAYERAHPNASIEMYRQNPAAIRIRIIDPDFAGQERAVRHDEVWSYLDPLTEDVQSEISLLLLLTPEERGESFANLEFDHPASSRS